MKKILIALVAGFISWSLFAQAPIILQDGENTYISSSIDSVMAHAVDGASVYLPGGNVILTKAWLIHKKLHIFGAGHYPDSSAATSQTLISGNIIRFVPGSSGSSLTGFYFNNDIYFGESPTDVIQFVDVSRCNLNSVYLGHQSSAHGSLSTNIRFAENVIRGRITGSEAQYCLFENNIIDGQLISFVQNASFFNNIFNYSYSYSDVFANSSGLIVNNNIFTRDYPGLSASQINNNIFNVNISGAPGGDNIGDGNIGSQSPAVTFINADGINFKYSDDYRLKEDSPGIAGGTDGKDIGIYGGVNPYKTSAVPSNPHIRMVNIAKETKNGVLHVEITAAAQEN
jgi:hypothetical protein